MIDIDKLQFQKLDLLGVKTLVKWAALEGWNPGPNDAGVFYATDPDGFWGYYLDGELMAGGSIVSYSGKYGFMGFFIVKPEYRSYGIGRKLWYQRRDTLLSRLKPGASIGMDGAVEMQPFYEKGGFEIAFRDVRYQKKGREFDVSKNITPITKNDIDQILAYDEQCFGFARPLFMVSWLNLPDSKTFKYIEHGNLKGFSIIRKVNPGYKVCPLFSDNQIIAEELYKACLNAVIGEPLFLDIPMVNQRALNIVNKYKAKYVFECARMYHGKAPAVEIDKVFGITTFELG